MRFLKYLLVFALLLTSCNIEASQISTPAATAQAIPTFAPPVVTTPIPARRPYNPGELVDYVAQSGDTLSTLAARFNTTVDEILLANPFIPPDATTMPPGMPMKVPIYYVALWGSPFQILPDHAFVNGPTLIGFNTAAFVASHPGWLKDYEVYAGGEWRSGAEVVDFIAQNYSLSPRLLLALLEYQGGALSLPEPPLKKNLLGFHRTYYDTPYLQLVVAASVLNNGYYGWRTAELLEFDLPDRSLVRPDPWQNAASVALQYYFAQLYYGERYTAAIGPEGVYKTYVSLFGDPWSDPFILIPGSLQQPPLELPFPHGSAWTYTGGPHTGWGSGEPLSAIDFAPPADKSGCFIPSDDQFATAMADGLVVRSGIEGVVLDLDKDGDERTGWALFYLHLATKGRAPLGAELKAGDMIGYPSCEGGRVTGTHVHIARKYNGEWILADGSLAFNLEGWIAHNGSRAYLGTLTNGSLIITACECSDLYSQIWRK
ncbi:MAG: LysM peptidoglycan-binding domain-containing protein [Chloroflexota bacterium]